MEFGLVILWLLTLLLLGAVALPVAAALLPNLEHGAFTFPLALAVLAVVGHIVGHIAFGWPAVIAGLVVLLGASLAASRRVDPDRRSFAEASVVFVLGFLLIIAIRAVQPAAAPLPIAIGEKFLDYGLLRTITRSPTLPPEDMWFAGEPIRYYYGGHLTTVLLATLTGTATRFAYNLGLATFYATLATAAYGLAASIARSHDGPRRLAGGLGAFFVAIAGNLETPAQVFLWLLPSGIAQGVGDLLGLRPEVVTWTPSDFWYFDASRVFPVDPSNPDSFQAATEFPLFAWVNADLHAHMMSQPFVLLAAALLLGYWRLGEDDHRHRQALVFGALPPVAGLLALTNLWSFPTAGGLTVLALTLAPADPATLFPSALARRLPPQGDPSDPDTSADTWIREEVRRLAIAIVVAAVILVIGALWVLPFWLWVLLQGPGKSVALWGPSTPLGGLLLVHGAFLAAFAPYLARRAGLLFNDARLAGLGIAAFALGGVLLGAPAFGLLLPVLGVTWWLLRTRTDVGYEGVLILAGVGLVLIVELVTVEGERFNTIFKPYVDVWLFWAVATGVVLARLTRGAAASAPSLADRVDADPQRWRRTGTALTLALVLTTGLYAGFVLPTQLGDRSAVVENQGPTLDATAFVEVHFPQEAPAIRWLGEREGQPHIVTAAPGGYWWRPERGQGASAPATITGLPTVLGWYHERQYRGPEAYQRRLQDVETIYEGTTAEQAKLLAQYEVQYVYVGPAERASYNVSVGDHPALTAAYSGGDVVVYGVNQGAL